MKKQSDYTRDYIQIPIRKNKSKSANAPDFVAHNITSTALHDYIVQCVLNNQKIQFDFAINEKTTEQVLLVLSVPYFSRRPTTITSFLEESEQ